MTGARAVNDVLARLQYAAAPVVRRDFARAMSGLLESQWWPEERLRELQERRLQALLTHVWLNVPFYRRRIDDAGLDPHRATIGQIRSLPILDRATVQTEGRNLLSRGAIPGQEGVFENHTGGSTGEPLTFYQDRAYYTGSVAARQRDWFLCGYHFGDRQAFLWGTDERDSRLHTSPKGRLKDYLQNQVWVNTFHASAHDLRAAHERFLRFQPAFLIGFVSSVYLYARLIQELGLAALRPKAVQTTSEVLSEPERQLLEDTFRCPTFDRYGCNEAGTIAHECEAHDGVHIIAENNLVEIVRESGEAAPPGEIGYVVITNLLNRAMPLIRYRLGDLAVLHAGPCACGRGLPRLRHIEGRSVDVITAPGGNLIHGLFFIRLIFKIPGVKRFRVEQVDLRRLVIEIVPGTGFRADSLDRLVRDIHQQGDRDFIVVCTLVERLAPSKSGKFRYTSSRIAPDLSRGGIA